MNNLKRTNKWLTSSINNKRVERTNNKRATFKYKSTNKLRLVS